MKLGLLPKSGFQAFVDESAILSPTTNTGTPGAGVFHSTIIGRAPIVDISNNLKVSMGIERIPAQQVVELQNEFGPSGERVFGILNDDRGIIRFVGSWVSLVDTNGQRIENSPSAQGYAEVTFYGTGLNVLLLLDSAGRDLRASVDGGAEGSNLISATSSGVLNGRNYNANSVVNAASGLSLGVHTVKLRVNASGVTFQGFEILNSSTQLKVLPGSAILPSGQKLVSSLQSVNFNSDFEIGVLGTKGGRVLTYLKSDGSIGKAVTPTNASQLTLTSTDHSNEEIIRTYSHLEFSAGRTDDFSSRNATLWSTGTSAAFTLDDGTTTLTASGTSRILSNAYLNPQNAADFVTFTFIGTGLDIVCNQSGATNSTSIIIDGTSLGAGSANLTTYGVDIQKKIVSGLPYGTHTIKILVASASNNFTVKSFIVYGPKKPALPSGAIEIADYNVMANYTASTTETIDAPAAGSLRKMNTREMVYVGTWAIGTIAPANTAGGFSMSSTTLNSYVEYTFFGTGFEYRLNSEANMTQTVRLDGSITNFTAAGITNSFVGSGATWTPSAGTITGNGGVGSVLCISGLTLGLHTVRMTLSATSGGGLFFECLDVITPIHSPKYNLYGGLQSTLLVGSCAISDNRQLTPIKDIGAKPKSWAQAIGITASPTINSSGATLPCPDLSCTVKTGADGKPSTLKITAQVSWSGSVNPTSCLLYVFVDGIGYGPTGQASVWAAGSGNNMSTTFHRMTVSPGIHKIDIFWASINGTVTGGSRAMLVEEI